MELEFAFSHMVNASPPAGDVCFETSVIFLRGGILFRQIRQMLAFRATSSVILMRFVLRRVAVGCGRFGRNLLLRKCSVCRPVNSFEG